MHFALCWNETKQFGMVLKCTIATRVYRWLWFCLFVYSAAAFDGTQNGIGVDRVGELWNYRKKGMVQRVKWWVWKKEIEHKSGCGREEEKVLGQIKGNFVRRLNVHPVFQVVSLVPPKLYISMQFQPARQWFSIISFQHNDFPLRVNEMAHLPNIWKPVDFIGIIRDDQGACLSNPGDKPNTHEQMGKSRWKLVN